MTIRPQEGKQEQFLSSPADIAIYGGAAGGGKSFALLLEPLRHVHNPRFGAVIFRRTSPQIRNEGGLWDASTSLYPLMGARPRETMLEWRFPSGAKIRFAHLEHEDDKLSWQGSEIPFVGWDELTHFTPGQFWYLLSRNRSTCGVRPYVRGTTNPDAMSWVKGFLAPWVDTSHPEPAESGELRYMVRDGGQILWVPQGTPDALSVTFVRASIYDNRIFLAKNPEYLAFLKALPPVERARLLNGDWDIVEGGDMFDRSWFGEPVQAAPANVSRVRFWDMAGTKPKPGRTDPDWCVGGLLAMDERQNVYVEHMERIRAKPGAVEERIVAVAASDRSSFGHVPIVMEQEPGSLSLFALEHFAKLLVGHEFYGQTSKGNKMERAKPFSSYAQKGLVKIVAGHWNHDYLNELAAFPTPNVHDDQVDASSGAFAWLAGPREAIASKDDYARFWGMNRS